MIETPASGDSGSAFMQLLAAGPQLVAGFGDQSLGAIEDWRAAWRADVSPLVDGSLEAGPFDRTESIAEACRSSRGRDGCALLHMIALLFRPRRILELGTNLGISAAYLAMAQRGLGANGVVHTVDASPYRLQRARTLHEAIGVENVTYECGRFAAVVPGLVESYPGIDMVFIDAQVDARDTRALFNAIATTAAPTTLFLHGNPETADGVSPAWNTIRRDPTVYANVIVSGLGLALRRAPDDSAAG